MSTTHQPNDKQAIFFIRASTYPTVRQEYRVAEKGVLYIKTLRAEKSKPLTRLQTFYNSLGRSLKQGLRVQAPQTASTQSDRYPLLIRFPGMPKSRGDRILTNGILMRVGRRRSFRT